LERLIVIWVVFVSLFGDRFIIILNTGGRGILNLSLPITLILGSTIIIKSKGRVLHVLKYSKFNVFWLPYLGFSFILPLLGLLNNYPIRTSIEALKAINLFIYIILGYSVAKDTNVDSMLSKFVISAILLQFFYSLGQFLYSGGYIPYDLWAPFYGWDASAQQVYNTMVFGRSTGLYVNPNVLGLWALVATFLSLTIVKSRRGFMIIIALLTLVLSQSRGAIFALVTVIIWLALKSLVVGRVNRGSLAFLYFIMFAIVIITWSSINGLVNFGDVEYSFIVRLQSGIQTLFNINADENFIARMEAWGLALSFYRSHVLGTLGTPEYMLGSYIDNDWVRLLVQGGPVYVATFVLMLIGGFLLKHKTAEREFLSNLSVSLPILAISQIPLSYSPMIIYWFLIGIYFGRHEQLVARVLISKGFGNKWNVATGMWERGT